jgi:hypothetical protein
MDGIRPVAREGAVLGIFAGPVINSLFTAGALLPGIRDFADAAIAAVSYVTVPVVVDIARASGSAIRALHSRFKGRTVGQSSSEQLATGVERFPAPARQIPLSSHLKAVAIGAVVGAPAVAATALPVPLSPDTKAAAAGLAVGAVSETLLLLSRRAKTGKGARSAGR